MDKRKEFIEYAGLLAKEGYLRDYRNLALKTDDGILALKKGCDLRSPRLADIIAMDAQQFSQESPLAALFCTIFDTVKDARAILLSQSDYTRAVAESGKSLDTLLDDLAQLIGPGVPSGTEETAAAVLRKRNAFLIRGQGALCAAKNLYDLQAVAMVLEKGCRAQIAGFFLGGARKISFIEALFMRFIYLKKYSREADKK